jgi:hypothetical protein
LEVISGPEPFYTYITTHNRPRCQVCHDCSRLAAVSIGYDWSDHIAWREPLVEALAIVRKEAGL